MALLTQKLKGELEDTMAMCGVHSLKEITREILFEVKYRDNKRLPRVFGIWEPLCLQNEKRARGAMLRGPVFCSISVGPPCLRVDDGVRPAGVLRLSALRRVRVLLSRVGGTPAALPLSLIHI